MIDQEQSYRLSGEPQRQYVGALDRSLAALVDALVSTPGERELAMIEEFGLREGWDFYRLPQRSWTFRSLARMVERVRREYSWFDWRMTSDLESNRGYFEAIQISAESGLPWTFDLIQLHQLKQNGGALLDRMLTHAAAVAELQQLLMTDHCDPQQVSRRAHELQRGAMKRAFLEQLLASELLDWRLGQPCLPPQATLTLDLGVEQLWNLSFLQFLPDRSMFEAYVVDLWQDTRDPKISARDGDALIDPQLLGALKFSADNPAWYVITSLDERFVSLHPVHVTKALIGPFLNNHGPAPIRSTLGVCNTILDGTNPDEAEADPPADGRESVGFLRFTRQYAYSPNHQLQKEEPRQVVYRHSWHDEIIVSPAAYSSLLARSLLGTQLRIVEL